MRLLHCAVLLAGIAGSAAAEPKIAAVVTEMVRTLRAAGYDHVRVERTLLNRLRILAEQGRERREIVIDPRTGELLRDWRERTDAGLPRPGIRDILRGNADHDGASSATPEAEPGSEPGARR